MERLRALKERHVLGGEIDLATVLRVPGVVIGAEDNPLVDTVYFLSDGMPSAGQYELPEEILIKLRYENRFRKVIFNTIALAIGKPMVEKASKYEDPDEMTAFMQMIADWNGGVCIDIRKPWSEEDLKKKG